MLQWKDIDTVLLDMDGTLLDLHFDNHFWMEYLPKRYAEIKNLPYEQVKTDIDNMCHDLYGKLEWYCLDYWGQTLQIDIPKLKREIAHLIQMRDDVPDFLNALKKAGKRVVLVTNAHPDSLSLKVEQTALAEYIDELISTHEFGVTKEQIELWQQLQAKLGFDKKRTVFIDDSLPILDKAKEFGIKHLLSIYTPDSKKPRRDITQYPAIDSYDVLTKELTQL
ncbi:GMP/IMP nucleotidase [Saccharobesus litoralis]|uniref:GMP/IMP nucleotidase n=1 Tax=Saccharobesus litoralis TaxID=2172099 RepID=A0A2S0VY40_9ALTE|nr:GMP/IMP nucleotidase [Saccharobesus litoralis]AWB69113.1 GMP/IMP nucleotidase [Saccharobesus litoralis]